MIPDVDVVLSLLDAGPTAIRSSGVNGNRRGGTARVRFRDDGLADGESIDPTESADSRSDRRECLVELDYIDQSIEIHRQSIPEYVANNGDIRFRHESLIERPHISNEEPLRAELASFIEAVASNEPPQVTIGDGITALEIAQRIEALGDGDQDAVDIEVRND